MRYFLNIIIAVACLTLLCGGITACGNPIECGSKGNGVEIPCETETTSSTVRTAPLSSSAASSANVEPSIRQPTANDEPSEPHATASHTAEPEASPATTQRPNPKYVTLGERALCAGQRIDKEDADGVRLFDTWAAFHPGTAADMTGFSLERAPDFPISAVIATSPGTDISFAGRRVLLNGTPLTGRDIGFRPGQSLSFFVNDGTTIDGFVFCE